MGEVVHLQVYKWFVHQLGGSEKEEMSLSGLFTAPISQFHKLFIPHV